MDAIEKAKLTLNEYYEKSLFILLKPNTPNKKFDILFNLLKKYDEVYIVSSLKDLDTDIRKYYKLPKIMNPLRRGLELYLDKQIAESYIKEYNKKNEDNIKVCHQIKHSMYCKILFTTFDTYCGGCQVLADFDLMDDLYDY